MVSRQPLVRQIFALKTRGAVAFFVITGLIFLIISLEVAKAQEEWLVILSSLLREMSTIFIVSGLWTGISELFLKNSFIEIFLAHNNELTQHFIGKIEADNKKLSEQVIRKIDNDNADLESSISKLIDKIDTDYTVLASLISEDAKNNVTAKIIQKIDISTNSLTERFKLSEQIDNLGLVKIFPDANSFDNTEIILEAKQLVILMNDARTWISNNAVKLEQRFLDPNKETTFYLLHPDSKAIEVIARKEDSTVEEVRSKLKQTISTLCRIKSPNTKLKVYGHLLFNPYSLYLTEKYAIYIPFMASKGRTILPVFQFENRGSNCRYDKIKKDIENLVIEKTAEDIINYNFSLQPGNKNS